MLKAYDTNQFAEVSIGIRSLAEMSNRFVILELRVERFPLQVRLFPRHERPWQLAK